MNVTLKGLITLHPYCEKANTLLAWVQIHLCYYTYFKNSPLNVHVTKAAFGSNPMSQTCADFL